MILLWMMMLLTGDEGEPQDGPITPDGSLTHVDDYGSPTGQGKQFITITTEIGEYFLSDHRDGKPYESFPRILLNVIACTVITGILVCFFEENWSAKNFLRGIRGVGSIIILEMVLSIPLYFFGKKYEWIRKNRKKALYIVALILCILLLILVIMCGN